MNMQLSEREQRALQALEKISAGQLVFLNIPDADVLVAKGLAELFGKGQYVLTEKGRMVLKEAISTLQENPL